VSNALARKAAVAGRRDVLTPEGVPVALTIAERGDRAAAFLIDACIIAIAIVVVALLASVGGGGSWTMPFVLLLLFLLRNFYFVFFEIRWRGQTPGKRALRTRVVDRRGGPLTADAIVARNLMREIEVFLPLGVLLVPEQLWPSAPAWARLAASVWVLVLVFLPFFNRDRLRIGDLVAGTMVVRAPRTVLLPDIGGQVVQQAAARHQHSFTFTPEQLDVYGIYELQVLEGVLRDESGGVGHYEALEVVAEKVKAKISWDRGRWNVPPEAFLREFYAALRGHLERKMLFGKRREDKFSK
jgi:uncharacterized RDD family membrane protein YckC